MPRLLTERGAEARCAGGADLPYELPALPLFFRADSYILPKWLKGVVPTGHQVPSTLWIETWTSE